MDNHLRRLEIRNFRGFDHLVFDDMADVNLIVGRNSVGKTALFEAIVLLGQPCHVDNSLAVNQVRGLAKVSGDTDESWGLLFRNRDATIPISLVGTGAADDVRRLTIQLGPGNDLYPERHERMQSDRQSNALRMLQQRVVRFDYQRTGEDPSWAIALADADQLAVVDSTLLVDPWMIPHPSLERTTPAAPALYSDLVRVGRDNEFVAGLRSIVPELARVVLLTRAGVPTLFAAEEGSELRPIQMLGEGTARVASWMLSMLSSENVLHVIDEVENGIHYSVLVEVWHAILNAARSRHLQVFATTHSYEAIQALEVARARLDGGAPSVRVKRLQRVGDQVRVFDYDWDVLRAAVEDRVEVR